MPHVASERLVAWDVAVFGDRYCAHARNQHFSFLVRDVVVFEIAEAHAPNRFLLDPSSLDHLDAETHMGPDAKLVDRSFQILKDFGLLGESLGPVGVQVEGEGVEVRVDITANTGVCVQIPCSTDGSLPFVNYKVLITQL
jgi:hypothetical protein